MQTNASSTSKVFLAVVVLSGLAVVANAIVHASSAELVRFASFLVVACVAARLKVKLPGLTGNMSVNLPFILVAVAEMSLSEAVAIGCLSTLVQCLPRSGQKLNVAQLAFNFCNMALAVGATHLLFEQPSVNRAIASHALLLAVSSVAFLIVNTAPVAMIIALTEGRNALKTWGNIFQLSFPYFVLSAAIAGLVLEVSKLGWQIPLLVLPIMFGVFHSYRHYFASEQEKEPLRVARAATAS